MITYFETIENLIKNPSLSPLPLEVIPNHMGINLVSVQAISWQRLDDHQLTNLTIHFLPAGK